MLLAVLLDLLDTRYRHKPKHCFASPPVILPRLQQDGQLLVDDSIELLIHSDVQEDRHLSPEDLQSHVVALLVKLITK